MNIKFTFKSVLLSVLCLGFATVGFSQTNTGSIRGLAYKDGKPFNRAEVVLMSVSDDGLYIDSITSEFTALNGSFTFSNVVLGKYFVKINPSSVKGREQMGDESETFTVTIQEYYVELAVFTNEATQKVFSGVGVRAKNNDEPDPMDPGTTTVKSGEELKKQGSRNLVSLAGFASGTTNTRDGIVGRGSRANGTAVYIDGVRVSNSSLTQSMGGQVDILQAGIPAQFGDFTGLGISITTKGGNINARKFGSFEVRSSSLTGPYGHNLVEGFYATPILWKENPAYKEGKSRIKRLPIAAMNFAANFQYLREPNPSYIGYQVIKPDALAQIEERPLLINQDGSFVHSANYLTEKDYMTVDVRPNVYTMTSNANTKFDFKLSPLATLSVFGNFAYTNSVNGGNNIMAYSENPMGTNTYALGYIKYTQSFKGPDSLAKATKTTLNNTTFTLRFDYQSTWARNQSNTHRDNFFNYGYIGSFKHYPTEFYSYYGNLNNPSGTSRQFITKNEQTGQNDTVYLRNFWEQTGFRDTLIQFNQSDLNRVRGNYTQTLFNTYGEFGANVTSDAQILQGLGLLNGYNPINIYSLWNTPGTNLASFSKSQSERYTLFAMGETEVKGPISSSKKAASGHKLQFGIQYEQSAIRGYALGAANLWRLMYQYANSHIAELDKSNPILSYDANGVFQDTIRYNRLVNYSTQSHFDKTFRDKLIAAGAKDVYGRPIGETTFLDINSYSPNDFSLDMFSADELLNNGSSVVTYYGYDHLGNKVKGKASVNDFLLDKNKRTIGAFQPIYTAAWFQDQFNFKDLEFRLGLRIERYDANQSVLKDPYSLYPIKQAGEVTELSGNEINHPSNIGSDYAVYVDDVRNPRKILGYRKDNTWYDEFGTQLSSPDLIANRTSNGRIAPLLVDPNNQQLTSNSFTDYKPKVNILPRIFFKFPLSDKSLFFASYDVLSQRPTANFATIDDYVFMTQKATNGLNNPALTSRITTDYQIGFKQKVSDNALLSFISYYRETKNDISAFQYNNAYPITYISYNNLDFSTVKGLILELDINTKNNISLSGNYTLQFADGTGSNVNSQRALIASNQPNLRSLFPLGDLDIRHQLKAIINWEFFDGKGPTAKIKEKRKYLGPYWGKTKLFSNTNFNLSFTATSGLPYTATSQPVQLGSVDRAPIKGTPFGSRLPWQLNTNLNIQKDIDLKVTKKSGAEKHYGLQVYVLVSNLFNNRNVYSVYQYTGAVDDDGFLNSPKGQQALQNQLSADAYTYYYKTAVNNPFNYQAPRMIYLGAKILFQ